VATLSSNPPLSEADELVQLRAALATAEQKNQQLREQVKQLVITEHKLYDSRTQLDSQLHTYRKLYELGKSLTQTFDLTASLTLTTEFVLYELGFERCLILLFNAAHNAFEVKALDGYYEDEAILSTQSLNLPTNDPMVQRLSQNQDYEICLGTGDDALLCKWRSHLGMNEYIVFALRQEAEAPLGLLVAGNTADRATYHTRVTQDAEGFLGLANAASQIATAINSVSFYQALNEERSHLEKRVRSRTQDLNSKNESLQATLKELKLTQAQLIQSEKMSGLGQLVAGIAHEINNPVSFIYGNLQHAKRYTQDLLKLIETYQIQYPNPHSALQAMLEEVDLDFLAEDLPSLMDSMQMGATRIEKIVLSLRTFSRMDEADMKSVDIHEGLDSTLLILDHRLNGKQGKPPIEVIKHYGDLPLVACYAGALNQVFMNILANAADAIEGAVKDQNLDQNLGQITITTEAHDAYVLIAIADNGPGIPEPIRGNIFNPFFTTKPVGQGTGMGLSISYQIVCDRHGGSLTCDSIEGQGTRFSIEIPTNLS
jgi:signal transduction histidine kinase